MQSELNQRTRTVNITIAVEGINETNWIRFMALSKEARQLFLSDALNASLVELLYRNPDLLADYVTAAFDEK